MMDDSSNADAVRMAQSNGSEMAKAQDDKDKSNSYIVPKLRRNKRLEEKMGVKYLAALRKALFALPVTPYVPAEPPDDLFKGSDEYPLPLYPCKECRDCFSFSHTFEHHMSRRSWMLGYWCNSCYQVKCKHALDNGGTPCASCLLVDKERRTYLKSRGLRKGQKKGFVRLFYNPCQFLQHLRLHDTKVVELTDVMLMPFSREINEEDYPKLDSVGGAIFEHALITRVHVTDWLKAKNVEEHWWKLYDEDATDGKDNAVKKITRGFYSAQYFNDHLKKRAHLNGCLGLKNLKSSSTKVANNNRKRKMEKSPEFVGLDESGNKRVRKENEKEVEENEEDEEDEEEEEERSDDPCPPCDFAFADCGPAPKPSLKSKTSSKKQANLHIKSNSKNSIVADPDAVATLSATNKTKSSSPTVVSNTILLPAGSTCLKTNHNYTFVPKISVKKFASDSQLMWTPKKQGKKETTVGKAVTPVSANASNIKTTLALPSLSTASKSTTATVTMMKTISTTTTTTTTTNPLLQKSKVTPDTRILTLRGPKGVDISTLIKQLPRNVTENKKIVFFGQQTNNVLPASGKGNVTAFKNMIPHQNSDPKKLQYIQLLPSTKTSASATGLKTKLIANAESVKPMVLQTPKSSVQAAKMVGNATKAEKCVNASTTEQQLIVLQNGKKYIQSKSLAVSEDQKNALRQSGKGQQHQLLLKKAKLVPASKLLKPKSTTAKLTPKPLPALKTISDSAALGHSGEQSTDQDNELEKTAEVAENVLRYLETDFTGERLKIMQDRKLNFVIMPAPKNFSSVNAQPLIAKYRQQMLNGLSHLSVQELQRRLSHFKAVHSKCKVIVGIANESMTFNHEKMLTALENMAKRATVRNNEKRERVVDPEFESWLNEWKEVADEGEAAVAAAPRCTDCGKITKPSSYVFGLSREPRVHAAYCSCEDFICHVCALYQESRARFWAHVAFHKKEDDCTCPECFQKFETYKKLEYHSWTSCFHSLSRRLFYCKVCQIDGFEDLESLSRHFELMHSQKRVACSKCRRVFTTHRQCREHQQEDHAEEVKDIQILKLLICNVGHCVVSPNLFRSHMNAHIGTQVILFLKCPICQISVKDQGRGKELMKHHLYTAHKEELSKIMDQDVLNDVMLKNNDKPRKENAKTTSVDPEESSSSVVAPLIPKIVNACTLSTEVFENDFEGGLLFMDQEEADVAAAVDSAESIKVAEIAEGEEKGSDSSSLKESISQGSILSKDKVGNDNDEKLAENGEKESHESTDHDRHAASSNNSKNSSMDSLDEASEEQLGCWKSQRPCRIALNGPSEDNDSVQDYKCHLCGELINTSWSVVEKHFATKHADTYQLSIITPKLLRITNEFIERGYQDYVEKRRKSESGSPHKRRKRWTPKKHTENTLERTAGFYVKPESVQDAAGNFVCKKCEMHCENVKSLREHIAAHHRIRGMYLICLECGDNFIVAPSLQMHLKAFHGIEDCARYMSENPAYASEVADEESTKTTVPNQCYVCMAVFEDKAAMNKHLRVHGMAFLKSKRFEARNAASSPKPKLDSDLNSGSAAAADAGSSSADVAPPTPSNLPKEKIADNSCDGNSSKLNE